MSGRRIKGYKYMVIKNQTKTEKRSIFRQSCARQISTMTAIKTFKLMYNFFGLLFGMMFVRYLIFEMLGSSERQPVMMVLYGIVGAAFLISACTAWIKAIIKSIIAFTAI